ncbi:hypothetical protein AB0425_40785 [Actinosynnema sp. NPDC051121]
MGDFEVTIETLRGQVVKHDGVREDLSAANERSRLLARVQPPMQDAATTSFVTAAGQVGQSLVDSVTGVEQELRTRIEELKASIEQYAKAEQANTARFTGGF